MNRLITFQCQVRPHVDEISIGVSHVIAYRVLITLNIYYQRGRKVFSGFISPLRLHILHPCIFN